MAFTGTMELVGKSGRKYQFNSYDIGGTFLKMGGLYCFTATKGKSTEYIYIGHTADLSTSFVSSSLQKKIDAYKPTHISIYACKDEDQRIKAENDILSNKITLCNDSQ